MTNKRKTRSVSDGTVNEMNRRVMKATIISGTQINKQESNALDNDKLETSTISDTKFIEPPYEPEVLAMLPENSSELVQAIEAMEVNIEGFGQRVIQREGVTDEVEEAQEQQIKRERMELKGIMEVTNADDDMTSLRRKTRKDIEIQGNGYWEILVARDGSLAGINYLRAKNMRISMMDSEFTEITKKYLNEDFEWVNRKFFKKFRRFIQVAGTKKVWFKEWDDPRVINKNTGEVIERPTARDLRERAATGVLHFKIHSGRTTYGLPRTIGNLFSLFGSRAADVINYQTFRNNNVPSMIVSVSNGMLTQDTIDRMEEFVNGHIKRSDNWSKFLILEAETQDEEVQQAGAMKIDVKPLTSEQRDDQLFQKYDENNAEKVRRSFRLPQIFVGKTENINRATTDSSRRLAEEQVFGPERMEIDRRINAILVHFGYKYHVIKSNSPNVTDDQALTKVLSGAEKSGALTPNLARHIISDILNEELEPIEKTDKFDPDIPFSLTMAEAVKKRDGIAPNQGQLSGGESTETETEEEEETEEEDDSQEKSIASFLAFMENPGASLDKDIGISIFADEDDEWEDEDAS